MAREGEAAAVDAVVRVGMAEIGVVEGLVMLHVVMIFLVHM